MAYERREFSGNAVPTTITAGVDTAALTMTLAIATGWPTGATGPFIAVIDRGLATEEKILINSRTGNTLTLPSGGRGIDNTSAASHSSGAPIEHSVSARDLDEANAHIASTVLDHHTQYLRTDGTRAFTGVSAIASGTPTTQAIGDAPAAGSGTALALITHKHGMPTDVNVRSAAWSIGDLKMSTRAAPAFPAEWNVCDGSEVNGTTYAALATELGTGATSRYGAAAAGNVKLPDMRRAMPMGKAASGTGSVLGGSGGSKDAIAVAHGHNHQHAGGGTSGGPNLSHRHYTDMPAAGGHNHDSTSGATNIIASGSGPYNVNGSGSNYVTFDTGHAIRTSTDGSHDHDAFSDFQLGTHEHTAPSTGFDNTSAGVSGTDANLPPYVVVNFFIKVA